MSRGKISIVSDIQIGSVGKGSWVAHMANQCDMAVRTGAIQAGHTIYHNDRKYAMQSIPCTWINPDCELVIGANGMIRQDILERELEWIRDAVGDPTGRVTIDYAAGVMDHRHADLEKARSLSSTIGSTCEGVGEATADKVRRILPIARDVEWCEPYLGDTVTKITNAAKSGKHIVLEGTQGIALSLSTARRADGNPFYPNCTSRECTPASLMADCGLQPGINRFADVEVIGMMRTYPIRIAGPSGDMVGKEITWGEITRRCGSPTPIEEKTTVTKRVRRVAEIDWEWMKYISNYVMPDKIVITFIDYINYEDYGKTSWDDLSDQSKQFIAHTEKMLGVPVIAVSTGPANDQFVEVPYNTKAEPIQQDEWETTASGIVRKKKRINPDLEPVYKSRIGEVQ